MGTKNGTLAKNRILNFLVNIPKASEPLRADFPGVPDQFPTEAGPSRECALKFQRP